MASARVAPIRPAPQQQEQREPSPIESFHWLTCRASAEIAVPLFTVGDLLNLRKGTVVHTDTASSSDIPVYIDRILLGRGQFEVAEKRLTVRLTELA